MANTTVQNITEWDTIHQNGPFTTKSLYSTRLAPRQEIVEKIDRYNDATAEIQRILRDCLDQGEGFRAFGSKWSLSNIAHHHDRMHFNGLMNLKLDLKNDDFHPLSAYASENLFFFQCGNTIKEISNHLFDHKKSLKTCGASNGQTIAGCISTGVHGSAFNVGSIQDYVVGINLITGPEREDVVYLERHTSPAMSDEFGKKINAVVIRNDALFNAALVSLGSFGFIHGVTIEAEDLFLLKRYIRSVDRSTALQLATSMDFTKINFIKEEVKSNHKMDDPYHYKIFINPYSDVEDYRIELIYKKKYHQNYLDPLPKIKTAVYRDLITLFLKIASRKPKKIPKLIKLLSRVSGKVMPRQDGALQGTLREIFWDARHEGPVFACAVGVAHSDCAKALDVLTSLTRNEGPVPGIFAMRFVKASTGTLAFTQFPITCMLEIDGIQWQPHDHHITLEQYQRRMLEVLEAHNIRYTIHWGKNAHWSKPGLIHHMYGPSKIQQWIKCRNALLSPAMAEVFSNDFIKTLGLDTILHNEPELASMDVTGHPIV